MTILIILGVLAGLAGLGVAATYVHSYSNERYGYSPFKVSIAGLMVLTVVLALIGLPPAGMTTSDYFDLVVAFQWSGISNSVVGLLGAIAGFVTTFVYVLRKTNFWIALFSLLLMLTVSAVALALFVLYQMLRKKKVVVE